MLRSLVFLCSFIIFDASLTTAHDSLKYCPRTCETIYNYVSFNDTAPGLSRKVKDCRSEQHVTSLYLCFDIFCSRGESQVKEWIYEQSVWCTRHAGEGLPDYHTIINEWTPSKIDQVRRVNASEALSYPVLSSVALPDDGLFARVFSTVDAAFYEYDIHLVYGIYMIYFWVIVVAIGTSTRLLGLIGGLRTSGSKYKPLVGGPPALSRRSASWLNRAHAWIRQRFTLPATFGGRCSEPYGWCSIPARAQSLTIFAFVFLNIIACVGDYRLTEGNIYWPEKSAQLLRYVSDRTGIVSLANFPLIWLFGMRNDVLLWLTGWGFGTFNAFHRWVARVATVEAVVHSIGYTIMIWESGGMSGFLKYWTKHYFWNGELSTIAMCALLAFSLYGLRRAHYEIFLILHIVLSIVALWTMYYHVEIFVDGEWNVFIWPCLTIWIFDRLLRGLRVLMFDWKFWNTCARLSYNASSDLIRLEIPLSRCLLKQAMQQPGCYYYIYSLNNLLYAHQSHPFTLAYVRPADDDYMKTPLRPLFESRESSESDSLLSPGTRTWPSLVFLIRPYDGFTSRLKAQCLQFPCDTRVLVEGPYGHSEPLHTFTNVIFIAGGTGIAMPLSYMARLLSSDSAVQRLKIIWAVRQHAFLASVLDDFKGLLADERTEMEVHVTRHDEAYDDVLGEDLRNVRLMTGRPDVHGSIQEMASAAGQHSLAVVACGPALMADEARRVSVAMLAAGHSGVHYFEESFKW